jgi:hypothetical protein
MVIRNLDSIIKALVLAFSVTALCLASSCEKAPPQQAQTSQQQGQSVSKSPDQQSSEPAKAATEKRPEGTSEKTKASESTKTDTSGGDVLVPIDIRLPRPMFVGTPQDTKVANLRKPLGKPRPPFLAPEGTKNVAAGKPVKSSDEEPIIGEISMITDGDKEAADGSYVELGPFLQHVTVDLQSQYEIYAIVVWHYHKEPRVFYDVIVQVCDDPDFINNVKTVFNNDIDNTAGFGIGKDMHYTETAEGELIDCKGISGRYVRLYSNGNTNDDQNYYIEVEVYGKTVQSR